jgi:hypothetical protein
MGVAPLCLLLNTVTVELLSTKGFRYDDSRSIFYQMQDKVGIAIVLCALVCIGGILVLACMFTASASHAGVLLVYFLEVQVYSFCLNVFTITLSFMGSQYLELMLFGNPYEDKAISSVAGGMGGIALSHNTFSIGRYYLERNMEQGLKLVHGRNTVCSDKLYFRRISFVLFQMRPFCKLYNFDLCPNEVRNFDIDDAIEMVTVPNPLTKNIKFDDVSDGVKFDDVSDRESQSQSQSEKQEPQEVFGFCLLKFSYTSKVVGTKRKTEAKI